MKGIRTIVAVMLAVSMVILALAGCTSGATTASSTPASATSASAPAESSSTAAASTAQNSAAAADSVSPAASSRVQGNGDPIKIAVVMYNFDDDQGKYVKQCGAELEKNFNVKFDYVTSGTDPANAVSTIESECSKGVDGIITAMTAGFQSWADICKQNKVPFSILLNTIDQNDEAYASTNEYFTGSFEHTDWTDVGKAWADYCVQKGFKNTLLVGMSKGYLKASDQEMIGFAAEMDKAGAKYTEQYSKPEDEFAYITSALADQNKGYDAVGTTVSTLDFALANVYKANLAGKVKVFGMNIGDTADDAFKSGTMDLLYDNFTAIFNINFATLVNSIEGNKLSGTPQGYWNIEMPPAIITSADELAKYRQYSMAKTTDSVVFAFNTDDIKQFIVSYNPQAKWTDLQNYLLETTVDKVAERHSK